MRANQNKIKIMYLTHRNAQDKREWSGTMYYMGQALSRHAGEVVYAGPYYPKFLFLLLKAINKVSSLLFKKRYNIPYNYFLTLAYKHYFTKKIKKENPDIIFAPASSGEMSQLKVDCPLIYLGDITLSLLIDRYPNFTNLSKFSRWEGEIIENKTFKNADALVFSSEWAADSARNDYNVPEEKIHLIPYGANMDIFPDKKEVAEKDFGQPLKLLFLGVDWKRKGGEIVFNTFMDLQNRGVDVELTVCGCTPPEKFKDPKMKVIPFLNKNDQKDAKVLYEILLDHHFLFVPSRSDCTPIAFCEANAFGLPVVSTDVGGISSLIKDGVNGHVLTLDAQPENYAEIFSSYYNKESDYRKIVKSSREYYDKILNWDHWGDEMSKLMNDLIKKQN